MNKFREDHPRYIPAKNSSLGITFAEKKIFKEFLMCMGMGNTYT
jgi:hypothetical protein